MAQDHKKIINEKVKDIQKEIDKRKYKDMFATYMQIFFLIMLVIGFVMISILSAYNNQLLEVIIGFLCAIIGLVGFLLCVYYESRIDYTAWNKALWIARNWLTTDIEVDQMLFRYHHSQFDDDVDRALGILHYKYNIKISK